MAGTVGSVEPAGNLDLAPVLLGESEEAAGEAVAGANEEGRRRELGTIVRGD